MEHVLECEERRIKAERLEQKTDRELLLEIARALPSIVPGHYCSYKDSIAQFFCGELFIYFREKSFKNTVVVVIGYKTVKTEGSFTYRFEVVDYLDYTEIKAKIYEASDKMASELVAIVKESELVQVKAEIKTFNDMRF